MWWVNRILVQTFGITSGLSKNQRTHSNVFERKDHNTFQEGDKEDFYKGD